jgi:hypothetical protein
LLIYRIGYLFVKISLKTTLENIASKMFKESTFD